MNCEKQLFELSDLRKGMREPIFCGKLIQIFILQVVLEQFTEAISPPLWGKRRKPDIPIRPRKLPSAAFARLGGKLIVGLF